MADKVLDLRLAVACAYNRLAAADGVDARAELADACRAAADAAARLEAAVSKVEADGGELQTFDGIAAESDK